MDERVNIENGDELRLTTAILSIQLYAKAPSLRLCLPSGATPSLQKNQSFFVDIKEEKNSYHL